MSELATPTAGRRRIIIIRWTTGIVFILFGAAKFLNHATELAGFRNYGLPASEVALYAIAVLELAGGLLLMRGPLVRPAAVVLAGVMVGAIAVSGIGRGEYISLTLAPALLLAMVYLILAPRPGRVTPGAGPRP